MSTHPTRWTTVIRKSTLPGFALLLAACAPGATTTRADPTTLPIQPSSNQNVRHARYCEVLPVYRVNGQFVAEVFNTFGLNDCPASAWNNMNADALKQEFGAVAVNLNGPRAWVMDDIRSEGPSVGSKQATFGGIPMIQRATVTIDPAAVQQGRPTPYTQPQTVNRTTTFVYQAGKPVYQLTAPDGKVYVMQTYDLAALPDAASLDSLATRLRLPAGWTFRTVLPTEPLLLSVRGQATVIRDNLQNTYQYAPELSR
ncbi:hypothetical protein [Deinococcus sp. ME38]|uniref:hypothetical protein n=1 Tax=Deinococcus sp. ME38 TaxID=3400344 RepID=UPI003B59ED05